MHVTGTRLSASQRGIFTFNKARRIAKNCFLSGNFLPEINLTSLRKILMCENKFWQWQPVCEI